jgi:hypothetical protein
MNKRSPLRLDEKLSCSICGYISGSDTIPASFSGAILPALWLKPAFYLAYMVEPTTYGAGIRSLNGRFLLDQSFRGKEGSEIYN